MRARLAKMNTRLLIFMIANIRRRRVIERYSKWVELMNQEYDNGRTSGICIQFGPGKPAPIHDLTWQWLPAKMLVEHVPQDERPQWKHNIGTCIAELPRPITKRPHRVNQAEIQNLVKFAKRSGVDEEQTLEILAFPRHG
jgi:hypothetical protein